MWLSLEQAAASIGVSAGTLKNYRSGVNLPAGALPLKSAPLPPGKIIVIKDEWLDEFIEQFATQESKAAQIAKEIESMGGGVRRRV
ncbi:MAG: hypothetical protein OEV91_02475 [Desulfobulbaceae bacterium]|nr:hypothetical protein [Desulfobulbaceae bacterium]